MFASYGRELTELNRLGELLDRFLLDLYGEPIIGAKFKGFHEIEGTVPSTRYTDPDSPLDFIICIPKGVSYDDPQLCWMLAHEMTHGLWPIGYTATAREEKATLLNEGLCEYSAMKFVMSRFPGYPEKYIQERSIKNSPYNVALLVVLKLLEKNPEIIKDVRKIQPHVNKLTIEDFEEAGYTNLDRRVMEQLLSPMPQQF